MDQRSAYWSPSTASNKAGVPPGFVVLVLQKCSIPTNLGSGRPSEVKEYLHQNGREPISRPLTFSARLYFMPNNTSLTEQELIEIGVAGYLQELRLLIHSLNSGFHG